MAMKFLGDSFDLHAGGEDLMFPHHENEIAQSESRHRQDPSRATGCMCASFWSKASKMSKSEGNFYTLRDLLLKGYKASAIRFLYLRALPPSDELHLRRPHESDRRRRAPAHLPPAHARRRLPRAKTRARSAATRRPRKNSPPRSPTT